MPLAKTPSRQEKQRRAAGFSIADWRPGPKRVSRRGAEHAESKKRAHPTFAGSVGTRPKATPRPSPGLGPAGQWIAAMAGRTRVRDSRKFLKNGQKSAYPR